MRIFEPETLGQWIRMFIVECLIAFAIIYVFVSMVAGLVFITGGKLCADSQSPPSLSQPL